MRGLIACECSGRVRDAFEERGFDVWSCDIKPTESEQTNKVGKHIQGDVMSIINDGWDFMIAFPPCTYLSYAGMANWYDKGRAEKRIEAAKFFMQLYNADIKHVAVENPRGIMSKIFREPDNKDLQPYFFGESAMKRTCLWLKNLPPLEYHLSRDLFGEKTATEKPTPVIQYRKKTGQRRLRYQFDVAPMSGAERSVIFKSFASAMAEQWGNYLRSVSL